MLKKIKKDNQDWVQCICDKCKTIALDEERGFDLMPDENSSSNMAMELGWELVGHQICPKCIPEKTDYAIIEINLGSIENLSSKEEALKENEKGNTNWNHTSIKVIDLGSKDILPWGDLDTDYIEQLIQKNQDLEKKLKRSVTWSEEDFENQANDIEENLHKSRYRKIYKKKEINRALYVMECPECELICASASERMYLPDFTTCSNKKCNY